jgi:predicted thioesterase
VDVRRVVFDVRAWDGDEKIGEGRHQRVAIDIQRFLSRVESKKEE